MKLNDLRTAIVNEIKIRLPDLAVCKTHPGRFDLDDLGTISTQTPAVLVACLGVSQVREIETEERDLALRFAAFILTKDGKDLSRDEAALNIIEALSVIIPGSQWGIDGVQPAKKVAVENIGNTEGVAIWAVAWEQTARIGVNIWNTADALPQHLYVSQFPIVGNEHETEYTELTDV